MKGNFKLSTVMALLSVVSLPLKDSSGTKVNGQEQEPQGSYSNSHAHIQYPSNSPTQKGKLCEFNGNS